MEYVSVSSPAYGLERLQPGGQGRRPGGRPPRCRATAPRDLCVNSFVKVFAQKSLPPRSGAAGVFSCKFRKRKYIFVKNENKKYKNIKTALSGSL